MPKVAKREPAAAAVKPAGFDHHERISKAAYYLWEKRQRAHGLDWEDWFIAESVVYGGK